MVSDRHEQLLPGPAQAVYAISVAAELAGIGIQTLRLYEQHGLITPARSAGGTRRYSGDDLTRMRRIAALAEQGVNLAAIGHILELQDDNSALRDTNAELHHANNALRETNSALAAERDHLRRRQQPRS
ncbi:MerR family transcriptional regulator [Nocardia yunnanensis]|uniref:MerR family transcriptional regulator n=1 Tax=Nocardia yunnanensis TaxID=2382165 RepID=A0A386ZMA4_9NOCA|nr:MerR family transcriptional regulator [Nocardia yunnanensis]AYF77705.1 MerR family transcriptional regulator [Nocardia yunnanensis]